MDTVFPQSLAAPQRELAMRMALAGLILFLAVSDGLAWQLSLGHGLSVKNVILYLLALGIAMKFVVQQNFRFELRSIQACFVILLIYAMVSLPAAGYAFGYSRTQMLQSVMAMKGQAIDHLVYFLVSFYALRESSSAYGMIRFLLVAVVFANCTAVLDAFGVMHLGGLEVREDGRVEGVIGESNQYAAYVCLFLPGMFAAGLMSHGVRRIAWFAGLLISTAAYIMAVSRGAYVAVAVALVWGAALFPRYISMTRIIIAGSALLGTIVLALVVGSTRYGELLAERIIGQSSAGDFVGLSSGRTEIWSTAIMRMAEMPMSFITGFGWNAYDLMPFRYATHNHYVWLWFNLGLIGLICGIALFVLLVREARAAVEHVAAQDRPVLLAFVVGTLAFAIATFFVDLYSPWAWFWLYAGLAMRIAVNTRRQASQQIVESMPAQEPPPRRDPFGWAGTVRQ